MSDLLLAKWGEFLRPSFATVIEAAGIGITEVTTQAELADLGDRCHAIFVRMPNHVSRELISSLPQLRVVAVPGAGLEVVDLDAATDAGVAVVDGRGIGSAAVVEWTLASMLWLARDIGAMQNAVTQGNWHIRHAVEGRRDLRALTVGIVGYGAIGGRVARSAAAAFGSRVFVNDGAEAARAAARRDGFEVKDLPSLLATSDIVSIHTQVKHGEPPLIGPKELALMTRGSFLLNTTRGQVLDYNALTQALDSGQLGGAAVDVYPTEPPSRDLIEGLAAHPRVLLSPHQGGMTVDAVEALANGVAAAVVTILSGGRPDNCANPQVLSQPQPADPQ